MSLVTANKASVIRGKENASPVIQWLFWVRGDTLLLFCFVLYAGKAGFLSLTLNLSPAQLISKNQALSCCPSWIAPAPGSWISWRSCFHLARCSWAQTQRTRAPSPLRGSAPLGPAPTAWSTPTLTRSHLSLAHHLRHQLGPTPLLTSASGRRWLMTAQHPSLSRKRWVYWGIRGLWEWLSFHNIVQTNTYWMLVWGLECFPVR